MVTTRRFYSFAIAGLCLGLLVAGCGRKAGLETPGAPTVAETTAVDPAVVAATAAQVDEEEKKTFFLDPLIGANKSEDLDATTELTTQ